MVFTAKTTPEERALIRFLYSENNLSFRKIGIKTGRSAATLMRVIRYAKRGVSRHSKIQVSNIRRGSLSKLSNRQQRLLIRALHKLRRTEGTFTAKRLMKKVNISESEGLNQYCTAKGSKVGTGGKVVKFLVACGYFV